ncbi:hypothetical protein BDV95DRAFT_120723 [Massariosphaeria phaeospora]|uniref:Up-regulated during septation protein 1 domain-containing protein n=1 Tax=Massariosphaeria phaeospora TaxID=100035 RepID=A0A7C8I9S0_9PLEO|nr:hypothetical protein BDV95DRAFT_120723 [Massariosphaeria phaeospora]
MAHESSANSDHRLHAPPKSSRMENIRSLSMRDRPRSGTPKMERSISSMTDSFMLEHYPHTSTPPQTPQSEVDSLLLAAKDDLTPISNWAHLTYLKKQRNSLRTELKAQQIAGAEVRASVAGLRRVAFRMAVNISVKEKQIATTARNLMSSRRNDYLSTRNAERRIEQLTMILKEEERRNRDILESLERASMLTLEYSNPEPQPRDRNQSSLLSPPPSPPTRLSALTRESPPTPKTPTRSNHASWDNIRWDLTPGEIHQDRGIAGGLLAG